MNTRQLGYHIGRFSQGWRYHQPSPRLSAGALVLFFILVALLMAIDRLIG